MWVGDGRWGVGYGRLEGGCVHAAAGVRGGQQRGKVWEQEVGRGSWEREGVRVV